MIRALLTCRKAVVTTEFAIIAPAFLMGLFGIIETSRLLWSMQTLEEVAFATARCMSVSSACDDADAQRDYAVARAGNFGLEVLEAGVTPTADTTCNGLPDSSSVVVTQTFNSVMDGFVPGFPMSLSATGCYPTLPST